MKALLSNSKTFKSLDLTTNCPKRAAGNPCSYCYVESARRKGFRAKTTIDRCEYNDEITRMEQGTIDKLNQCGGLRVFSFGDYMSWMDPILDRVIEQADERKLMLKAITKVPEFILKYHEKFDIIHVSIDAVGDGVPIETALKLKRECNNVLIRAAIMNDSEVELLLPYVDIFTFNHANNKYHHFTKSEILSYGEKLPGKVCCLTGSCLTCDVKCGNTKIER